MLQRIGGALFVLFLLAGAAAADDKPLRGVALVIGQSDYTGTLPKLANPRNDATAMGELLGKLGFQVTSAFDDDRSKLADQLTQFDAAAKDADVALVYYSGHGIEAGGVNYLVPTDADLSSPSRAGATLLPVTDLLDNLARTVPVTIVLLDACRSDAFPAGTMIQPPGARTPIEAQATGLGELRGPTPIAQPGVPADNLGMVIGFAASPGQPALDGAPGDPNSPYAAALLKHLAAGGYSFGDVMTMVSEEVYLKTKARQLPWVNSSLRRILSFGKIAEADTTDVAAIKAERRKLLLTIAGAPDTTKATVETVAAKQDVPLDQVYGMLNALGVDTSDPTQLQAQLDEGTQRVKKLAADAPTVELGDEVGRAVALAEQAQSEGAFRQAIVFRERAVDAARATVGGSGDSKTKRQLAALLADAAEAEWSVFDLDKAAENFAEAQKVVAEFDEGLAAHYRKLQADALAAKGEFRGDNDAFDQAMTLYDEAMGYYDGQADDDIWAETANDFAKALAIYGDRREDNEYLEDAEHNFQQVAKIWTKDSKPNDWARVQNNLGNIYASLGDRGNDPQRWQQAVSAYNAALEVWTEDETPLDWASAQNNLGTVFRALGNYGKDTGELKKSASAYQAALRQWTRPRDPFDWAMAQNNLGNALTDLAKYSKKAADWKAGLAAYDAALEIWTRDKLPLDWAATQNNIGATYGTWARQLKGADATDAFHKAVDAYKLCLEERTKDRDERNWALTNYNLGLVLTDLADQAKDNGAWQQAVDVFTASLEVYTEDQSPSDYADAQEGLGWAEANLGFRTKDRELILHGRDAMKEALRIYQDYNGAEDYYKDRLAKIDKMLKSVM